MGAQCRHLPTCSQFAKDALRLHGPLRGSWYVLKRILRCHPWATPVFDPVPPICSGDDQSNADGRTPADGHTAATAVAPDEKVFVMNSDNRNLLLAVALSMAVLFGWQILVVGPEMEKEAAQQQLLAEQQEEQPAADIGTPQATAAADQPGTGAIKPRQAIRQQPSPIRQSGLSSTRRWSAVPSHCRVPALMMWF